MLSPGTHVIAMGSDLLGKRELADDVLLGADLLVADDVSIAVVSANSPISPRLPNGRSISAMS